MNERSSMNAVDDSRRRRRVPAAADEPVWRSLGIDPSNLFIDGHWQPPGSRQLIDLQDPSSGDLLCGIARGEAGDIDRAVAAARRALDGDWGRSTALERGRLLSRLGARILDEADMLARLEAVDVGKPLTQARGRCGCTGPLLRVLRRRSRQDPR